MFLGELNICMTYQVSLKLPSRASVGYLDGYLHTSRLLNPIFSNLQDFLLVVGLIMLKINSANQLKWAL